MEIGVEGIHLFLQDQTVQFVEHQDWFQLLLVDLPQASSSLRTYTFHHIHDDDGSITQPYRRGNLTGKVHVTGGINQIDEVVRITSHFLRFLIV